MKVILIAMVRLYQRCLRPMLHAVSGTGGCCRYQPSCSSYFIQAVEIHGAWKGALLGVGRIMRCHPWGGFGADPVPPKGTPLFQKKQHNTHRT